MSKNVSLSIIVPAYNEENHIRGCLDSIARQTVAPNEVIIVDNNSSDTTAGIAASYPFVTVLHEKKQGVVFARNRGFDAATGEIIGRFNADVILEPQWVEKTKQYFQSNDVQMVTGYVKTKLLPSVEWPYTTLWTAAFYRATRAFFGTTLLWGANMAITKKAWKATRDKVSTDGAMVHEDVDIGLCILEHFKKEAVLAKDLSVKTNEQSYHYWPKLKEYLQMYHRTYKRHSDALSNFAYRPGPHSILDLVSYVFVVIFVLISIILFPFAWSYRKLTA